MGNNHRGMDHCLLASSVDAIYELAPAAVQPVVRPVTDCVRLE